MSTGDDNEAPPAPASATDTGYFTDAADLGSDVPGPAADPDRPRTEDSIDGPGTTLPAAASTVLASLAVSAPGPDAQFDAFHADRAQRVAAVRAAIAFDAPAAGAFERLLQTSRADAEAALLPNLAALAARPRTPALMENGIAPELVLSQVVRHLDDPLRVAQGRGRGTCGAATLEYLLLRTHPAEFVRLVDGITGIDGKVDLRAGGSLELLPTALPRDDSGRVDVDRLLQSALMAHATAMSWIFDYDDTKDDGSFWAEIAGNSRAPIEGLASLWARMTGETWKPVETEGSAAAGVAEAVAAATAHGTPIPVLTAFGAPDALHWLTAEKVDPATAAAGKRGVYLRNPWGSDDGTGPPERWPLSEGGGRIAMEFGTFTGILRGAVMKG
jgi:hypothetical protein